MNDLIFIGPAPGRGDSSRPLEGVIGEKLRRLLCMSSEEWLLQNRANLNKEWPGKKGKGDNFDTIEGYSTALFLMEGPYKRFVLLGENVTKCFYHQWEPLKIFSTTEHRRYLLLPHPSGINTWWNSRVNVEKARTALQAFVCWTNQYHLDPYAKT